MTSEIEILGRWSIGVQWASVVMIAAFFAALTRKIRLTEVRLWAAAWLANVLALSCAFATFFLAGPWARLTAAGYSTAKTSFVVLLLLGARHLLHPGGEPRIRGVWLAAGIVLWSALLAGLMPTVNHAHFVQCLVLGTVLVAGGVAVLRPLRGDGAPWIGGALVVEGALFLHYLPFLAPVFRVPSREFVTLPGTDLPYFSYSSFVDAGVESLVALASLVALSDRVAHQLREANAHLMAAQDELRQLADLDPLTTLANRRRLPGVLRAVQETGATFLFFDLDDFKEINDRHGHSVGDACLERFAAAVARAFRPGDAVIRYGGDEFLVVASGLELEDAHRRAEGLRLALAFPDRDSPPLRFSVGVAQLEPGGDPEATLLAADQRMYEEKRGDERRAARG